MEKRLFIAAGLALVTPADDLQAWPEAQVVAPVESSWGEHGHASMWLDPVNDWIPQAVYGCAQMLAPYARLERSAGLEGRALVQAFRELLLAQSSDFAFILRQVPGAYIFLGNGDSAMLHNPEYDFNDEAIAPGVAYWTELARTVLPP